MIHLPINKVYIFRRNLFKDEWDWLRDRVGVPNDSRMWIALMEPSETLKLLHEKVNARRTKLNKLSLNSVN